MTINKVVALLFVLGLLSGCAGIGVGTYGTFESKISSFNLSEERGRHGNSINREYTKEEIISLWGEPDETGTYGACETITYYDGYSWSGAGALVVIIPVPLLFPSGHDEDTYYFRNGKSVGLKVEHGGIIRAYGFFCRSNDCGFIGGEANPESQRKVKIDWCY